MAEIKLPPALTQAEQAILEALGEVSIFYKDGRTPADTSLTQVFNGLINTLNQIEYHKPLRKLNAPSKYPLIELFEELKFGRPSEDQKYLDVLILEIKEGIA